MRKVDGGTYDEWESQVPDEIRSDTVWRAKAYRLGMFLADLAWDDVAVLRRNVRLAEQADQLARSTARVGPNVSEGYSRDTGRGRATYYEYALGSARESRDWYYQARRALAPEVVRHRLELCTELAKLLLTMIANERRTNRRASGTD